MTKLFTAAALALTLGLTGLTYAADDTGSGSGSGAGSGSGSGSGTAQVQVQSPQQFVRSAGISGMYEVKLCDVAAEKATNDQVKTFAKQLSEQHKKVNDELKSIATSKNLEVPDALPTAWQQKVDQLQAMSGSEFDKQFILDTIAVHKQAISLFKSQSDSGTDADIKAFATRTLPALQDHLKQAQQLQATLLGSGATGGSDTK